jgi:hypothetical protein
MVLASGCKAVNILHVIPLPLCVVSSMLLQGWMYLNLVARVLYI